MKRALGLLLCMPLMLHAAEGGRGDELAGEAQTAARPVSRQASTGPEEMESVSLTRNAGVAAPTFKLPEFIVTGGGVTKAYSSRPKMRLEADTSGGIRASPGEWRAGKDQMGAKGRKVGPKAVSATARPGAGQVEIRYGLENHLRGSVLAGQEWRDFYFLVQGDADLSDGGEPVEGAHRSPWNRRGGRLLAGWNLTESQQWEVSLETRWRDAQQPYNPAGSPWIRRGRNRAQLTFNGDFAGKSQATATAGFGDSRIILPGSGLAYWEQLGWLGGTWDRQWDGGGLEAGGKLSSRQDQAFGSGSPALASDRSYLPGQAWFLGHLKPTRGSTLGVGLRATWISGDMQTFHLAPLVHWEQSLGSSFGLFADFEPEMKFPSLSDDLLELDPVLPNHQLLPAKEELNLRAGLRARWPFKINVEAAASLVQNVDHFVIDDPEQDGYWQPRSMGRLRRYGVDLRLRQGGVAGFSHELLFGVQRLELAGWQNAAIPLEPEWKASYELSWRQQGPWSAGLKAGARSAMAMRLMNDPWANDIDHLPAAVDLSLRAAYQLNAWLSVSAYGENLLSMDVADFSGYTKPAPGAGLGLQANF